MAPTNAAMSSARAARLAASSAEARDETEMKCGWDGVKGGGRKSGSGRAGRRDDGGGAGEVAGGRGVEG